MIDQRIKAASFGALIFVSAALAAEAQEGDTGRFPDIEMTEDQVFAIENALYSLRDAYQICAYLHRENTPLPIDDTEVLYLNFDSETNAYTSIIAHKNYGLDPRDWQNDELAEGLTGEVMQTALIRSELYREDANITCTARIGVPKMLASPIFYFLQKEFGRNDVDFSTMPENFEVSVPCAPDLEEYYIAREVDAAFWLEEDAIRLSFAGYNTDGCPLYFGQ